MNKTTIYIVIIVVLLAINGGLLFSDSSDLKQETTSYFATEDLQKSSRFAFSGLKDTTTIAKNGERWMVNDTYPADERFLATLVSILEKVEIVRSLDSWELETLGNVELEFDFNSRYRFEIASNPTKTKSYFITEDRAQEVMVPGYRDNVVDLFLLHPDQWRDRLILDASWRTIQQLTVLEKGQKTVQLSFDDSFFLVNGKPALDSSAVVDYLNQFQYLEANEMISRGRFPKFDSLANTLPVVSIEINDIKQEEPMVLTIFPNLDNQPYHLMMKENQMMVLDANRVRGLVPSLSDFLGQK